MKSFTFALISAYATAVQVTERWCTWEPEGGDVTKEWEHAWQMWNEPCPEGSRQIGEYTNEMSDLEWLKTGQPIEQALREAEREMDDIKRTDFEWEQAKFFRDLQCMWANFEPVTEGGCPDYWQFKKDYCESHGRVWSEMEMECYEPGTRRYDEYMERQQGGVTAYTMYKRELSKMRFMVRYEASLNGRDIEGIFEQADAARRETEAVSEQAFQELEATWRKYEPQLEELERKQRQADEKAGEDVVNYFLDNIKVDGAPLRNVVGGPEQWVLKKQQTMQEFNVFGQCDASAAPDTSGVPQECFGNDTNNLMNKINCGMAAAFFPMNSVCMPCVDSTQQATSNRYFKHDQCNQVYNDLRNKWVDQPTSLAKFPAQMNGVSPLCEVNAQPTTQVPEKCLGRYNASDEFECGMAAAFFPMDGVCMWCAKPDGDAQRPGFFDNENCNRTYDQLRETWVWKEKRSLVMEKSPLCDSNAQPQAVPQYCLDGSDPSKAIECAFTMAFFPLDGACMFCAREGENQETSRNFFYNDKCNATYNTLRDKWANQSVMLKPAVAMNAAHSNGSRVMKRRQILQGEDGITEPTEVVRSGETLNITWDGPTLEELQRMVETEVVPMLTSNSTAYENAVMDAGAIMANATESAGDILDDARRSAERQADAVIQKIGSYIKGEVESGRMRGEVTLAEKAEEQSSNSVATGIGAGVVGALAGAVVYSLVNKKEQVAAEQPLL